MIFTQWGDHITITPADDLMISTDGPYAWIMTEDMLSTQPDSPNLIVKAAHLMARKAKRKPDVHIHVTKNIPAGRGLGGGSADAAAVMRGLNQLWDLNLSIKDLSDMGLSLGAELPVCILSETAMVGGIGDVVTPLDMALPPFYLVIAWPDEPSLTPQVFRNYRNGPYGFSEALPIDTDIMTYVQSSDNDLTMAAVADCPAITDILSALQKADGCFLARMSGSGSACFGLFNNKKAADTAASGLTYAIVTTPL